MRRAPLPPCEQVPTLEVGVPEIRAPWVRPTIVCVATLLPEPDSPTMPSVCPRSTTNERPRTAWTTPSAVANDTERSRTSSSAMSARTRCEACSHVASAEIPATSRPRGADHFSHTCVTSQLSESKKKTQFWTFDEWNTVHFWISTGTAAASFMSWAFACRQ